MHSQPERKKMAEGGHRGKKMKMARGGVRTLSVKELKDMGVKTSNHQKKTATGAENMVRTQSSAKTMAWGEAS